MVRVCDVALDKQCQTAAASGLGVEAVATGITALNDVISV